MRSRWWQGLPQDESIDVRTFQKEFAQRLKDATIETLVVLIDDLDRCSPERIVENLEAVKLCRKHGFRHRCGSPDRRACNPLTIRAYSVGRRRRCSASDGYGSGGPARARLPREAGASTVHGPTAVCGGD